jgi:hypothetical protein
MPIEKESYRDNLERIHGMFPDKELLTKTDVAKFLGVSTKFVCKYYPFKNNYISKATLARALS